jgi:hypothetical protein
MRTDGQTDMMKLIVAFRNFANALKKRLYWNVGTYIPIYMEIEEERILHQHRFGSLNFS